MARKKRVSPELNKADKRLSGMKSIDPALDLGNGVSVATLQTARDGLAANLDAYNTLLSQADKMLNNIQEGEKSVRDLCERALSGVASKYGKDSDEYEQAGGKRKSERKRPVRKKKVA